MQCFTTPITAAGSFDPWTAKSNTAPRTADVNIMEFRGTLRRSVSLDI